MAICYIGIGSNMGNRRKNIRLAVQEIKTLRTTRVIRCSKVSETKPVGGPPSQRDYLNAVLEIKTMLAPAALLTRLKIIEKKFGRKKTVRFGPRVIDLDILLYADKIIRTKKLSVPHPRIFERTFVLKPLISLLMRPHVEKN